MFTDRLVQEPTDRPEERGGYDFCHCLREPKWDVVFAPRQLKEEEMKTEEEKLHATCHQDGTVTYWSVYQQTWEERVRHVPDKELAAMTPETRQRVTRHLASFCRGT